jgi:ribonuclease HII
MGHDSKGLTPCQRETLDQLLSEANTGSVVSYKGSDDEINDYILNSTFNDDTED